MKNIRAEVTVHGTVQGVGFRFATARQAKSLGLAGWVRNTWHHSVEAVFEGEEPNVKSMVRWCHEGPTFARVSHVDVAYLPATGSLQSFTVRG